METARADAARENAEANSGAADNVASAVGEDPRCKRIGKLFSLTIIVAHRGQARSGNRFRLSCDNVIMRDIVDLLGSKNALAA